MIQKKFFYRAIIVMIGSIFLLPHLFFFTASYDEGTILNGAFRILNNQQLYTDFPSNIGPVTLYYYATIFQIFGPSYIAAKIFTLLFLVLSCIALIFLARHFFKKTSDAVLVVLLWLLVLPLGAPLISHNSLSAFSAIITFSIFLYNQKNKRRLWLDALVGFLSGLSVLLLITRGLALFVSIFFAYLIYNQRDYPKRLLAFLFSSLFTLTIMTLIWGNEWWLTPIYLSASYFHVITGTPWTPLVLYLILLIFFFIVSFYKRTANSLDLVVLFLMGLLLALSTFNLPDTQHIVPLSFTLMIFFVSVIKNSELITKLPNVLQQFSLVGITIITIYMSFSLHRLATINSTITQVNASQLITELNNEPLLAYPFGEYYYFITKQIEPPDISLPEFYAPQSPYLESNISAVLKDPPTFILTQDTYLERYNLIDPFESFKHACYKKTKQTSSWSLYRLKSNCQRDL